MSEKKSYLREVNPRTTSKGNVSSYVSDRPSSRNCKCMYCGLITNSDPKLPFFSEHLDKDVDRYYCGCRGWD